MELLTGTALLLAAITGIVELAKRVVALDWRAVIIIVAAALTGYLLGPIEEIGVSNIQGLVVGFGASGLITALQNVGAKSNSVSVTPIEG